MANQRMNEAGKKESAKNEFQVRLPSLCFPKGGGTIRRIGEKFTTNPMTGTCSMTIPIATSSGSDRFELGLELTYDSGSGNGPLGLGWHLSTPSIILSHARPTRGKFDNQMLFPFF